MNGGAIVPVNPPPAPSPSAAAATSSSLAPGFRFHPTDEELVIYYLKRKIAGRPLRVDAIAEVDLYKREPWDLPGLSRIRSRDREWYFFSPLDRKYSNRSRTNRATGQGYWKTTGKDRQVLHGPRVVGMKKILVFHIGRAPQGERTNWVMHEYRLEDAQHPEILQDAYVVCRIFQKNGAGPQNGAQYGAPFIEEDWEDEIEGAVMLPVGGGNELNYAGDSAYLEYKDIVPSQDVGNCDVASPLVNSNGNDDVENPDDVNNLQDSSFTPDVVNSLNEPGVWDDKKSSDVGDNTFIKNLHVYPDQSDEYVELMDLTDIDNDFFISSEDSVSNFLGTSTAPYGSISSYMQNIPDVDDTTSEYPGQPEFTPAPPLQGNGRQQKNDGVNFRRQAENIPLKDESDGHLVFTKDNFIPMNELLDTSLTHQHDFAMVDDLLAYFDATEGDLQNGSIDFPELHSPLLCQPNFSKEVNGGGDRASSSAASTSNCQLKDKFESYTIAPGASDPPIKGDNAITKRLVNTLGSISAPSSAFSAEFPPVSGKSVLQESAEHILTGMIHTRGLTVSSDAAHLTLQKIGDLDILALAYGIKPVSSEPIVKMQGAVAPFVLRGGLYLFFMSLVILTLSYKVGVCIYGK